MWDEWLGGKWVHQGAQDFVTKIKCTDGCLLNGITGPAIYDKIDNRSTRTAGNIYEEACRKWNSRQNTPLCPPEGE